MSLNEPRAAGLTQALCILAAENPIEAERARELTRIWPALRFGVGLHPHQAGPFGGRDADVAPLVRSVIASIPEARAVGEIGLDYHYDFAPKDSAAARLPAADSSRARAGSAHHHSYPRGRGRHARHPA